MSEVERELDGLKEKIKVLESALKEKEEVISSLSQHNQILSEDKGLFDAFMELPDPVFFKDLKGRYTGINQAAINNFGVHDENDILGKTVADFFTIEFADQVKKEENKIIQTGIPLVAKEEFQVHKTGKERWMSITKIPLFDKNGKVKGIFGLSRDISGSKRIEEHLSALMDNLPDAIYFKDLDSKFTLINKSCAKGFKIEQEEESYGRDDFDFFTKEHAQASLDDEQEVIRTGIPLIGKEELETQSDGRKTWISTTKLPLVNKQGRIIGTFGLSRNINRLKLAEEELQRSNERLEKQVQKRTSELRKANQEMEVRIHQLDYLNKKSTEFAQVIDKKDLLSVIYNTFKERIIEGELHFCEIVNDEWNSLFYTDAFNNEEVRAECIKTLTEMLNGIGQDVYFESSWDKNPWLKKSFSNNFADWPCYLVIPLFSEKRPLGVIQVFADQKFEEVFRQQYAVLNTLASQAAIALDNANHYQELGAKARIQSELEIAQKIQKRFIPDDPTIPNFKLKGICLPANEVGGDYLDYFQNEKGDWVVVIADVCGKGIPAALVMTSLRSTFRTEARDQSSSKRLLCAVNNLMGKDLQLDNSFITCICMVISKDGKSLNYTRAGHPMLISYNSSEEKPKLLPSEGIALGMVLGDHFESIVEEVTLELHKGDRFLAYTDGLNETMNQKMETYGLDRLLELLKEDKNKKPDEIVSDILKDLKKFAGGQDQHDDLTLVALERTS